MMEDMNNKLKNKNMFKIIQLHSTVDLITNSSTVIFTHSEGSEPKLKELINEILQAFGEGDKKFDDIFSCGVFISEYDKYIEDDNSPYDSKMPYSERKDLILNLIDDILSGKQEKPQWMVDVEESNLDSEYTYDTKLYVKAKDPKYEGIANKIIKFLYSTEHDETGY